MDLALNNLQRLICRKTQPNYSFICTQSNGSLYGYVIPIIHLMHIVNEFQVLLFNTNNSVQHYSFIYTQFSDSKYCYVSQTIQLNISHLFTHN